MSRSVLSGRGPAARPSTTTAGPDPQPAGPPLTGRRRVEAAVLWGALGLPRPVQRLLAGRPVRRDAQTLSPEWQLTFRMQRLAHEPGIETLPLEQARRALTRQSIYTGGRQPIGEVRPLQVDGDAGPLDARCYLPRARLEAEASGRATGQPLLVFFHGGGMVYGGLDSHDALCRFLAERSGVTVLAVDYRLAPEHPFPAPMDDAAAAYRWAVDHADDLGVDPARIAVGGDSAGAHLAAATALAAAEAGLPCAWQLLVYPVTDLAQGTVEESTRSRRLFGEDFFLTSQFIAQATDWFLAGADPTDPRASVLRTVTVPGNLAPAFVVTAGFDPLRDEGEAYARMLAEHGVTADVRRFPSLIHGFLNVVGAGRDSRTAVAEVAAELGTALSRSPAVS